LLVFAFIVSEAGAQEKQFTNEKYKFKLDLPAEALISETSLETSEQEFDDEGNLIHQVTTTKNILKPENADVVHDMTYDYKKED